MKGAELGHENARFLELLDPDPELARAKYLQLFKRLAKFFEWRNCQPADELAQETLKRGFKDLAAGREVFASDPSQFFIGYAKNIAREARKVRRTDSLTDAPEPVSSFGTAGQVEARLLLAQCLAVLSSRERDLVSRYYAGEATQLTRELGISAATLRVRVFRLVERVRSIVRETPGTP